MFKSIRIWVPVACCNPKTTVINQEVIIYSLPLEFLQSISTTEKLLGSTIAINPFIHFGSAMPEVWH
jgi:hypothetical protein